MAHICSKSEGGPCDGGNLDSRASKQCREVSDPEMFQYSGRSAV